MKTHAPGEGLALAISVFKATMEAKNADSGAWYFEDQDMTLLIAKGPKAKQLKDYARKSPLFRRGADYVKAFRVVYEK